MADPDGTRIGDADRQQVIDVLRRATGEGRLTLDEFADRAGSVFAARTQGELDQVVDDLPAGIHTRRPTSTSAPTPARPEAPSAGSPGRRRFVAIMGGSRPRGRWRAAEKITAFAFWGGVTVDLRQALIESPTVEITAWAIMGGVHVVVPEGIRVELDGLVIMGGSHDATRPGRVIDGAPVVRIRARGLWGGVTAWTRREREVRHRRGHHHGHRGLHSGDIHGSAGDERDVEVGDDPRRGLYDWPGVPVPPVPRIPPMPSLPGPSLGDVVPPTLGEPWASAYGPNQAAARRAAARATGDGAAPTVHANRSDTAATTDETSPAPAPPRGGTLTVLVTDICRSTEIAAGLGDQRWLGVLQAHNALVREQVHRHHGTEVKAQGDGFLVTFTSARQAVLAAIGIQQALASYRRAHPEHPIELRAGIHTGEVVDDHGDVIGQNVVVAVRIADVARPGEILVSSLTKDLTDAGGDLRFDDGRDAELKGVARAWRVHAVAWD